MSTDYPIRFAAQLRQHLRALRKKHGFTQAQLGALVGVSQARIAEIEANPGLVSCEQMLLLLAALGVTLSLQEETSSSTVLAQATSAKQAGKKKQPVLSDHVDASASSRTKRSSKPSPADTAAQPASQRSFVIRPKKGSW